ncbi:MAG TPA: hypothetical protein PKG98_11800 [Myxococcota bacterium]|jgi:hypothetical protein|nr:hypothetical protein [Myxococcota bacterium]
MADEQKAMIEADCSASAIFNTPVPFYGVRIVEGGYEIYDLKTGIAVTRVFGGMAFVRNTMLAFEIARRSKIVLQTDSEIAVLVTNFQG